MSKVLHGDTEGASKTEIGQFEDTLSVDEQVLRLEITMEDLVLVTLGNTIQQLVQERLQIKNKGLVNKPITGIRLTE